MVSVLNAQLPKAMKPTTKYTLLALANYANRYGENVFPSMQTLTRVTGLSKDTLRRAIDELGPAKILVLVADHRHDFPAEYRIDLDVLDELPRTDPRKARPGSQGATPAGSQAATPGGSTVPPQGSQAATSGVASCHPRGSNLLPEGSQGATQSVSEPSSEPSTTSAPQRADGPGPAAEEGTPGGPKTPNGKKPHPVTDTDVRAAVHHWEDGWTKLRGEAPHMAWPKMCGQLAPVVKVRGVEATKALLDRFFASQDRIICQTDYTLGAFLGNLNKLIGQTNGHGLPAGAPIASMVKGLRNFGARKRAEEHERSDRALPAGALETVRGVPGAGHE